MQIRIECVVSGRVQMVMYRDFVTRKARKLGVVGEVHNEKDGTVSVIAEAEKDLLEQLVRALHLGSILSHVQNVDVSYHDATGEYTQFKIRYQ